MSEEKQLLNEEALEQVDGGGRLLKCNAEGILEPIIHDGEANLSTKKILK